MGVKVFLDVGANNGQTLAAALDPEFAFDWIACFEPASACWPKLRAMADKRTTIYRYGLWNTSCEKALYQPGSKGAGIWKKDNGRFDQTEECAFIRASVWFRYVELEVNRIVLPEMGEKARNATSLTTSSTQASLPR